MTGLESDGRTYVDLSTDECEWSVEFTDGTAIAELKSELAATEPYDRRMLSYSVDRFAGLRIEIFAREHPPPHFRVVSSFESANYTIEDCEQLNGGLRREYQKVRSWHAQNKEKLIATWNALRPTDCPVGPYREEGS